MMETSTYSVDIGALERIFQQRLQEKLSEATPLQVHCYVKQDTVLVVVQHPAPVLAHPNRAFRLISQIFQEEKVHKRYRGLIYVRVQGQQQPYAFYMYKAPSPPQDVAEQVRALSPAGMKERGVEMIPIPRETQVQLEPSEEEKAEAAQANGSNNGEIPESNGQANSHESNRQTTEQTPPLSQAQTEEIKTEGIKTEARGRATQEKAPPALSPSPETPEATNPPDPPSSESEEEEFDPELLATFDNLPDDPDTWMAASETHHEASENPLEQESDVFYHEEYPHTLGEKLGISIIVSGIIVGIFVFLGSVYALTRPCVLRSCESLSVSQKLAEGAVEVAQTPPSGQALLQAQQQLEQAIALLNSIPSWSGKYDQAQALLDKYGEDALELDRLVGGMKVASQAANQTQNPPLPVQQWQASQKNWEEAIARLETLPPNSDFYRFARKKVQEYRRNVRMVERRLRQEKEALEAFEAAQEAAKIAQVRQEIAQSVSDLQLAYSTWQTVINRLKSIPAMTTSYAEAQERLKVYQEQLKQSEAIKNQEIFASDAYQQATRLAKLAQSAENRNQWTEAVKQWREAVNYLKQVPDTSLYAVKTTPLKAEYSESLAQAESRLQESMQVRQARDELQDICEQEPLICVFTVSDNVMKVRLTPTYIERVRRNARQAQQERNVEAQVNVLDHIFTLEQALQRVSDRTGIPLEIYTQDNILVKRYNPS